MPDGEARPVLCLDFGGTKLLAGIVDAATGDVLASDCRRTPAAEGARASVRAALDACDTVLARRLVPKNELRGVGISFGGPVGDAGHAVVRSMHVEDWEG